MWEPHGVSGTLKWEARTSAALHPTTAHVGYECSWQAVCKSSPLQVDHSGAVLGDKMPHIPGSPKTSTLPFSPHSAVECPSTEANSAEANCTSMAAELQQLLLWMVLDTSGPASGDSSPRRPLSVAWVTTLTIRGEDLLRSDRPVLATHLLVTTSQQVSLWAATPNKAVPISHLPSPTLASEAPQETSIPATPQPNISCGMDLSTLSDEVLWLQEEMNRALGHLLTTRASIDALCRKQVSDFETAFCQNEAQTTKAIKEMRAHCTTVIWDAKAMCTAAIREAEAACTEHAHILQQSHGECMQEMEREAIEEEGRDHQSFLTSCGEALWVCPPKAHGVLMYPLQLLMRNMSLAALLAISPQSSTATGEPALKLPAQLSWQPVHQNSNAIHLEERLPDQPLLPKSPSVKAKRGEVPGGVQGEPPGGLLQGLQSSPDHQTEVFWGTSPYLWPGGIPQPLWSLSGDDHICQSSRLWDLQNPRDLDRAEGPLVCPWGNEELAKGPSVFPTHIPFGITKSHEAARDPSSQCPLPLCWIVKLPQVQKGRVGMREP